LRFDLLKILLVDDNPHMRMLLTQILRAIDVRQIHEASDGAEALQIMRGTNIDIVFTDLTMQPLDGIDFVNLLRNSPDSPNQMAPVIMVTGHSTVRRIAEARDAGVNEILAKPVTARGVLSRISEVIENPRPFVRTPDYFGPERRRRADPGYTGPMRRASDGLGPIRIED
jgi:CheY-like chemotaxis protein